MLLADATVHTAGVNWESAASISASVVTLLALIGVPYFRQRDKRQEQQTASAFQKLVLTEVIPRFDHVEARFDDLEKKIQQHDTRLSTLEGIAEGRRQVVAERFREPHDQIGS